MHATKLVMILMKRRMYVYLPKDYHASECRKSGTDNGT